MLFFWGKPQTPYLAGFTCKGHNLPTLLVIRRASNHSPSLPPIVGGRM